MSSQPEVKQSFNLLIICTVLTVVLWFIPYAEYLVYPFRLFVTLVHEVGHAVAAWISFGSVHRISMDWLGNGVTETSGGIGFLISSAGYLGTTAYGAGMLLLLRRARLARIAAIVTGSLLLPVTVFFASGWVAVLVGIFFAAGLLLLGLKGSVKLVWFLMSFLSVQLLLNAFYDLRTLMYLSVFQPAQGTDAQNMAAATNGFVPALVWAVGWSLVSLGLLTGTLLIYYRSLKQSPQSEVLLIPETGLSKEKIPLLK
jgi:hypothetical protein